MDVRSLSAAQIAKFNDECADLARRWRRIVAHMQQAAWDRSDPAYLMAVALRDTAVALATLTHEARDMFRDKDHEYSKKRSAASIDRTHRRDVAECGLDPLLSRSRPDPDAPPY